MKKLFLVWVLALPFTSNSQNFKSGLFADHPGNYALGSMPSLLVDRESKWDIHLVGSQFNFFNSDNSGQTLAGRLKSSLYASNPKEFFSIESSQAFLGAQLALPSISYAINRNNVIAFSTSVRTFTYQNNSGLSLYNMLQSVKENRKFTGGMFDEFLTMYSNTWLEFGLSYAKNWNLTEDWSLQGGFTLRYLSGVASGELALDGLSADFSNSNTNNLAASVSLIYNDNVDQIMEGELGEVDLFSKNGYALNFGISAKWHDQLTIGVSVLDIGSIGYTGAKNSSIYEVSGQSVNVETYQDIQSVDQLADTLEAQIQKDGEPVNSFKTTLPLKILLFAKYQLSKRINVVASTQMIRPNVGLIEAERKMIITQIIAPTFKIKKMTISLPFGYSEFTRFQTGLGFQWRFLTFGSDNVLSYYLSNSGLRAMNLYCSLRITVGKYE